MAVLAGRPRPIEPKLETLTMKVTTGVPNRAMAEGLLLAVLRNTTLTGGAEPPKIGLTARFHDFAGYGNLISRYLGTTYENWPVSPDVCAVRAIAPARRLRSLKTVNTKLQVWQGEPANPLSSA